MPTQPIANPRRFLQRIGRLGVVFAGFCLGGMVCAQTPVDITVTTLPRHIATYTGVRLPGGAVSNEGLGGFQVDVTAINGTPVNLAPHATFCTELGENISARSYTEFDIVQLQFASAGTAGDPGPSSSIPLGGIGLQSAAEMRYLFDVYYVSEDLSLWTPTQSQAFQIAVWEIGHDPSNFNVVEASTDGGVFYFPAQTGTGSTERNNAISLAQSMLDDVSSADVGTNYASSRVDIWSLADDNGVNASTGYQDILFATLKSSPDGMTVTPFFPTPVPETTSLVLVVGGLVALLARRSRRSVAV